MIRAARERIGQYTRANWPALLASAGAVVVFAGDHGVARAKGELVEALPADGVAILNADDERVAAMASRTPASVVTYGAHGDVRCVDLELDEQREGARVHAGGKVQEGQHKAICVGEACVHVPAEAQVIDAEVAQPGPVRVPADRRVEQVVAPVSVV